MSARSKKRVSVAPGIRTVTLTPLSLSTCLSAIENESMNALEALETAWNVPGMKPAIEPVNRILASPRSRPRHPVR
jgi:hypothetical protein